MFQDLKYQPGIEETEDGALKPFDINLSLYSQTVTEKHKMNVPETMNEVLDMSDDEGKEKVS